MNITEKLNRFFQGVVIALALSFLVVGYAPQISFGVITLPSFGLVNAEDFVNAPVDPGTGRRWSDIDGDYVHDYDDDCPSTYGTSTEWLEGCPDDDGDGYSNKKGVCPNNTNHKTCLTSEGVGSVS